MRVFYMNRKYIYMALLTLIIVYVLLFYLLSLQLALAKLSEVGIYEKTDIYTSK